MQRHFLAALCIASAVGIVVAAADDAAASKGPPALDLATIERVLTSVEPPCRQEMQQALQEADYTLSDRCKKDVVGVLVRDKRWKVEEIQGAPPGTEAKARAAGDGGSGGGGLWVLVLVVVAVGALVVFIATRGGGGKSGARGAAAKAGKAKKDGKRRRKKGRKGD